MSAPAPVYAPAELRDRFLNALDARDDALCGQIALDLKNCSNPLPGLACQDLGLPPGSTYGSAARQLLGPSGDAAGPAHEAASRP